MVSASERAALPSRPRLRSWTAAARRLANGLPIERLDAAELAARTNTKRAGALFVRTTGIVDYGLVAHDGAAAADAAADLTGTAVDSIRENRPA